MNSISNCNSLAEKRENIFTKKFKSWQEYHFSNSDMETIKAINTYNHEILNMSFSFSTDNQRLSEQIQQYDLFDTHHLKLNFNQKYSIIHLADEKNINKADACIDYQNNHDSISRIVFDKQKNIFLVLSPNKKELNIYQSLLSGIFSYTIKENGYLPLHSALIQTQDNKTVAIIGEIASGKTSFGTYLAWNNNCWLLADDWLLIDCNDPSFVPKTICKYGYLRSIELNQAPEKINLTMINLDKSIFELDKPNNDPSNIDYIIILDKQNKLNKINFNFDKFYSFIKYSNPHYPDFENQLNNVKEKDLWNNFFEYYKSKINAINISEKSSKDSISLLEKIIFNKLS